MSTATVNAGVARGVSPIVSNGELLAKYPTEGAILAAVASGALTVEAAGACLGSLERKANRGKLTCKVSQKGCVSVYGLQRMPVTLYAEQWERLLDFAEQINVFISEQNGQLARKAR